MEEGLSGENGPEARAGSLESSVGSREPEPVPEVLLPEITKSDIPKSEINTRSSETVSKDASEEISKSEIPKSEINTMEVHHHPEVEKKGLKEYLLEGLMIFLAVMMGFFAESLRENISEKRIEKEFVESFVADLKKDTATFNIIIPIEATAIRGLDSMLVTLGRTPYTDSSIRFMYYLNRKYTAAIEPMSYTLRTITQLKYAGGLRLIADKKAADSIILYNKMVDDITSVLNYTTHDFMIPSLHLGNKIFNAKFLLPYDGESVIHLLNTAEKINLLPYDESTIAQYTGLIYQVKQIRQNYFGQLQRHKERAIDMISFFQKEYHLGNE
jgi:hypothetical protein